MPEPAVHVVQADAGPAQVVRGAVEGGTDLVQGHPVAVVGDLQDHVLAVVARPDLDPAVRLARLDGIVDAVLHQRLQRHEWTLHVRVVVRYREREGEPVAHAHLLDVHVVANMVQLAAETHDLRAALLQHIAHHVGEGEDDGLGLPGLLQQRQPADGVQHVEQEVRIDLAGQRDQFRLVQHPLQLRAALGLVHQPQVLGVEFLPDHVGVALLDQVFGQVEQGVGGGMQLGVGDLVDVLVQGRQVRVVPPELVERDDRLEVHPVLAAQGHLAGQDRAQVLAADDDRRGEIHQAAVAAVDAGLAGGHGHPAAAVVAEEAPVEPGFGLPDGLAEQGEAARAGHRLALVVDDDHRHAHRVAEIVLDLLQLLHPDQVLEPQAVVAARQDPRFLDGRSLVHGQPPHAESRSGTRSTRSHGKPSPSRPKWP